MGGQPGRQVHGGAAVEAGEQEAGGPILRQAEEAAPYIPHAGAVQVLPGTPQHHQGPCAGEGGEEGGLPKAFLLLPFRHGDEEEAGGEGGQFPGQLLCQAGGVGGGALGIPFPVAEAEVLGGFLAGEAQGHAQDEGEALPLFLVEGKLLLRGALQGVQIVRILLDGGCLEAVEEGDALVCGGVFPVFHAVSGEEPPPIDLGFLGSQGEQFLIGGDGQVEIPPLAQFLGVEVAFLQGRALLPPGKAEGAPAMGAGANGLSLGYFQPFTAYSA